MGKHAVPLEQFGDKNIQESSFLFSYSFARRSTFQSKTLADLFHYGDCLKNNRV